MFSILITPFSQKNGVSPVFADKGEPAGDTQKTKEKKLDNFGSKLNQSCAE